MHYCAVKECAFLACGPNIDKCGLFLDNPLHIHIIDFGGFSISYY